MQKDCDYYGNRYGGMDDSISRFYFIHFQESKDFKFSMRSSEILNHASPRICCIGYLFKIYHHDKLIKRRTLIYRRPGLLVQGLLLISRDSRSEFVSCWYGTFSSLKAGE